MKYLSHSGHLCFAGVVRFLLLPLFTTTLPGGAGTNTADDDADDDVEADADADDDDDDDDKDVVATGAAELVVVVVVVMGAVGVGAAAADIGADTGADDWEGECMLALCGPALIGGWFFLWPPKWGDPMSV